jgi:hypothetical protein
MRGYVGQDGLRTIAATFGGAGSRRFRSFRRFEHIYLNG